MIFFVTKLDFVVYSFNEIFRENVIFIVYYRAQFCLYVF